MKNIFSIKDIREYIEIVDHIMGIADSFSNERTESDPEFWSIAQGYRGWTKEDFELFKKIFKE